MGGLDIEFDHEGNIWYSLQLQGALAKFDRKAEQFKLYPFPDGIDSDVAQQAMVSPVSLSVDGKVWMSNVGGRRGAVHRVDLASGKFETFENMANEENGGGGMVYGMSADSKNNLYFMDFGNRNIGRVDAKTGALQYFSTPTPDSRPRRGRFDSQDRLWFAEYRANKVAMLDTKTEKFTEWAMPTQFTHPYDAEVDKNGRGLDRRHDHGPDRPSRHQNRPGHRVPHAPRNQPAPGARRQQHKPGHLLVREQPLPERHQRSSRLINNPNWLSILT